MKNLNSKSIDRLYQAILNINDKKECEAFFDDICTIKEIQDMAQRLDTAILLTEGMNYQKISSEVGVSTATISRVSGCLNYGEGGYKTAIDKLIGGESK